MGFLKNELFIWVFEKKPKIASLCLWKYIYIKHRCKHNEEIGQVFYNLKLLHFVNHCSNFHSILNRIFKKKIVLS